MQPFFVLDLYLPPGLESSGNCEPADNLLIVGPPGSGKTDTLRKQSGMSVFDVRALAYVEAEAHVPDFAFLGPMSVPGFPPGSEPEPSGLWADPMETPALRAGGVLGIDHLGLLLLTQQQLVDAWVGYVPALAPVVPTVVKLFGAVQRGAKSGAATA